MGLILSEEDPNEQAYFVPFRRIRNVFSSTAELFDSPNPSRWNPFLQLFSLLQFLGVASKSVGMFLVYAVGLIRKAVLVVVSRAGSHCAANKGNLLWNQKRVYDIRRGWDEYRPLLNKRMRSKEH